MSRTKRCVVLLSGGLDSATILYEAIRKGFEPHCLIFKYGQRHHKEIKQAQVLARRAGCVFEVVEFTLPWKGSSLIDLKIKLPHQNDIDPQQIPSTYVPARNIIFLSFAASFAEAIEARAIFIGANAIDYSGYPDCRPSFFDAYSDVMSKGTKAGVQGKAIKIYVPLLKKSKAQIIKMGIKLGVPYDLTWSCYQGSTTPCGVCDSCRLRAKGFVEAGVCDPAVV